MAAVDYCALSRSSRLLCSIAQQLIAVLYRAAVDCCALTQPSIAVLYRAAVDSCAFGNPLSKAILRGFLGTGWRCGGDRDGAAKADKACSPVQSARLTTDQALSCLTRLLRFTVYRAAVDSCALSGRRRLLCSIGQQIDCSLYCYLTRRCCASLTALPGMLNTLLRCSYGCVVGRGGTWRCFTTRTSPCCTPSPHSSSASRRTGADGYTLQVPPYPHVSRRLWGDSDSA